MKHQLKRKDLVYPELSYQIIGILFEVFKQLGRESDIGDKEGKDRKFSKKNIDQVVAYLKSLGLKLGILANFTAKGVEYRRILNLH